MDRNQITGIVLIALILIGYSYFTAPTKEQIEKARQEKLRQDSLRRLQDEQEKIQAAKFINEQNDSSNSETVLLKDSTSIDTTKINQIKESFGSFGDAAIGKQEFFILENENIKLKISTKGGRPYSAEMKKYKKYDSTELVLFDGDSTIFGMNFFAENRKISTNDLFFTAQSDEKVIDASQSEKKAVFRLYAGKNSYIEYTYSLKPNSYLVDFDIRFVGMEHVIGRNSGLIDFNWYANIPSLEKGWSWENRYTELYWKYYQDDVDYLSASSKEDEKSITTRIRWIAYKQQFFSSILIAKQPILSAKLRSETYDENHKYLKRFNTNFSLEYNGGKDEKLEFVLFYGPNKHSILKGINVIEDENLELTKLLPLGWTLFRVISEWAIIPLFDFLGKFISNYGLIILLMTIIIKMVLFPFTYKSYVSSAKMRVLKPQIDEINKKIPKDKAMERQQATMALYRKAGVNPMGGCLPMLFQMPILLAMFYFFPSSIELRQQPFLWAHDLSSYDSIFNLPFSIPFYGDHVSLFTLLMAVSMIFSTKMNSSQMQGSSEQMPGMKMMMYMMPVMMLLWFNQYSAGLSYYYFLSNIITIGQTVIIRRYVDDDKVLQKLNENKKKPKKKSKFQAKLDEMAKQQREQVKKKPKKR